MAQSAAASLLAADTFPKLLLRHARVRGTGVLITLESGEPVKRAPELHIGFRVPSMQVLNEWAGKFGKPIKKGEEFNSFQTFDPEENCLEIYCKANT